MNWLKWICVILASTLEVSVRADEKLKYEPINCWLEAEVCAVQTQSKWHFRVGEAELSVVPNSFIRRLNSQKVDLIKGAISVEAHGDFEVSTVYGVVKIHNGSHVWVLDKGKNTLVRVISGGATLSANGAEPLPLKAGFENDFGKVKTTGVSKLGLPRAMDFVDHVLMWSQIYDGNRDDFIKEVDNYKPIWKAAFFESKLMTDRIVAYALSEESKRKAKEEAAAKAWQEQRNKVRSLMLDRLMQ